MHANYRQGYVWPGNVVSGCVRKTNGKVVNGRHCVLRECDDEHVSLELHPEFARAK